MGGQQWFYIWFFNECIDDNLMGSTSPSPVFAGGKYTCSVTAINTNGTDAGELINIVPTEGEWLINTKTYIV